MSKKKINILKDLLNEVPHLLGLSYQDNEYNKWRTRVLSTLETLFGKDSQQYKRFSMTIRSYKQYPTPEELQSAYCKYVGQDNNTLDAIIAGLEQEEKVKDAFKFERVLKAISNWVYSKPKLVWYRIMKHKILSVIYALLVALLILLGTNWNTIAINWNKLTNFLRSVF